MIKQASSVLLVALLAPVSLRAQASTTVSSYMAADGGISGSPVLVGGAVGAEAARLGIRLGAALDPRLTPPDAAGPGGFWSAEADVMLYLDDPRGDAAWVPYLVAGSGLRSFRGVDGAPIAGMVSYGAGARVPLLGGLALEAEARHRKPLAKGPEFVPEGISSGLEARVGLSFRTGGGRARLDTRPVPSAPRPLPLPSTRPTSSEAAERHAVARRALDAGDDFLGVRYKWGGNTPSSGFDCSGFIRYVYRQQGVELPRVSRDQAVAGTSLPLDLAALEPGDLMAFASKGGRIDHIAIYAGDGRILHSSSSGGGVRYDDLHSQRGSWYLRHWVAATRVIRPSPLLTQ
jgi:hypothetical protein